MLAPVGAVPVGNHESEGLVWVRRHDLPRYDVDPGTLRMADAALSLLARLREAGAV